MHNHDQGLESSPDHTFLPYRAMSSHRDLEPSFSLSPGCASLALVLDLQEEGHSLERQV